MSADATRELVERFVRDVWNGGDLEAIGTLAAPDLVVHGLGAGVDRSRDEFVAFHRGLLEAVPDLTHHVEDVVVEGDDAVAFVRLTGTPERRYGALAPTGETFDTVGFQKYRIADGSIVEVWVLPNAVDMLRQLGVFPDSPAKVLKLVFGAIGAKLRRR